MKRQAVCISLVFIFGIAGAEALKPSLFLWALVLSAVGIYFLLIHIAKMRGIYQNKIKKRKPALLMGACCFAALIGYGLLCSELRLNTAVVRVMPYERNVVFTGMLEKTSIGAQKQKKMTIRLYGYESLGRKYSFNKKVRCVLNCYGKTENNPGDILVFRAKIHRLKAASNPGEKDRTLSDRAKNILGYASTGNVNCINMDSDDENLRARLLRFRQGMSERLTVGLQAGLPSKEAIVLKGFVLGDVDGLDEGIKQDFMRAGIYHIMSVSGLHVSFLILLLSGSLSCLKVGKKQAFAMLLGVLVFYAFITGAEAPIIRSALMGIISSAAMLFSRKSDGYTSLAVSAAAVLLVQPLLLFTPSFQLSFIGTLAMMLASAHMILLPGVLSRGKGMLESLYLSAGVVAVNAPITAYHFGDCSMAGIFANIAAIPMSGLSVCLGMLSAICGLVSPWFAACINSSNYLLLIGIEKLAAGFAKLPLLYWDGINPSAAAAISMVIFFCLLLSFGTTGVVVLRHIQLRAGVRRRFTIITGAVILPVLICIMAAACFRFDKCAHFVFLDVGQGNCMMLVTPNRHCILFDCGGDRSKQLLADVIAPAYRYYGCKKINAVFITHPHQDHMAALAEFDTKQTASRVYLGGGDTASYFKEMDLMTKQVVLSKQVVTSCDIIKLQGNKKFKTDDGISITCLVPPGDEADDNDDSMLIRLDYGDFSCLIMGDAGKRVADFAKDGFLDCDVLQVPHHGARNTATDRLVALQNIKCGLISCGEGNSYGHPADETLQRYNAAHKRIFRTDRSGAIDFSTDGRRMCIKWFGK